MAILCRTRIQKHNGTYFFEIQPKENETPEKTRERLPDKETKCSFEKITAAELIIATIRSIIKKELKEKLEKATQKILDLIKILQHESQEREYERKRGLKIKQIRY